MEMLVFGSGGQPVILFPTEQGRYFDAKDFGIIGSLENYINEGKVKIYCPDSFDSESWYNYNIQPEERVQRHLAFEKAILNDVIEFAYFDSSATKVGVCGLSFGGYHALNIALKYPVKVNSVIIVGGFFDIKRFIFGYYDDNCYFNNPVDFVPNLNDDWYLEKIKAMKIIFSTGSLDPSKDENIAMNSLFNSKQIKSILDLHQDYGHDWHWWRDMIPGCFARIV